jgi:hypothetical protein
MLKRMSLSCRIFAVLPNSRASGDAAGARCKAMPDAPADSQGFAPTAFKSALPQRLKVCSRSVDFYLKLR